MLSSNPKTSAADGLYAKLTLAAFALFIVLETAYFLLSGIPRFAEPSLDFTGYAVGRDFITTWMGGRSVLGYGPSAWFDPAVHNAALRVMLGSGFPQHIWSYPPHLILFTWPLGLLPYLPAYLLWCALGIILYLLTCAAVLRGRYLLFLAAAPGVAVCVFFGQNGFYTAALLIGGFALLGRYSILAGILFGILTIKPQFAILLPFMLVLSGRWWALLSAVVTAGGLAVATTYMFGPEVWSVFIHKVIPYQIRLLESGGGLLSLTASSVFSAGRVLGLPADLAWNLQGLVSLVAVVAVVWAYGRKRDPVLSMALFVTATFLASPYVQNHDMVIFGFIIAALRQHGGNTATDHTLGLAIWSLPVTMMLLGAVSVPLAPVVLMAFGVRLLSRLAHTGGEVEKRDEQQKSEPKTVPPPPEPTPA